jgi:hypothetical protein
MTCAVAFARLTDLLPTTLSLFFTAAFSIYYGDLKRRDYVDGKP